MEIVALKVRLSILLIASHLIAISLLVILFVMDKIWFTELTTGIALITPIFVTYSSVTIKYVMSLRGADLGSSEKVPLSVAFVSFFLPGSFSFLLIMAVLFFGLKIGFKEFDQFKIFLASIESIFGVYLANIVPALFSKDEKSWGTESE